MLASVRSWRWRRILLLGLALVFFDLPLLWTVLAAFGVRPNNTAHPPTWSLPPTLNNYLEVVTERNFLLQLGTSAVLSALTTFLTVAVAFLAAYSLSRVHFQGRRMLVQGFLILASLPVISYVIPLKDTLRLWHLYDTLPGIALAETALYAPLAVYVLFGYLVEASRELEQSARLDGASAWQIIARVVLPIAMPGIAATAIIVFVLSWNLLLMPFVLTANHVQTLPVMISDFFTYDRELEWDTAAAALVVSLLPIGLFVAIAHRALERFSLDVARAID